MCADRAFFEQTQEPCRCRFITAPALYGIATTSEEYNRMTLRENLLFALTGWLAGVCIMLGVGFIIFPALVGTPHSFGAGPDRFILLLVVLLVSPAALVGGLVGGRLPKEGGQFGQLLMAAIAGIMAAVPVSCVGFWYTGW
jgi:hypothetical protein